MRDGRLQRNTQRNELTYHLAPGWDAVLDKDVDSERAETTELEKNEPRFGTIHAARRVARTIFLGSAPSSVASKAGVRGLDRSRILLGCFQPGQTLSTYSDALNRLADFSGIRTISIAQVIRPKIPLSFGSILGQILEEKWSSASSGSIKKLMYRRKWRMSSNIFQTA